MHRTQEDVDTALEIISTVSGRHYAYEYLNKAPAQRVVEWFGPATTTYRQVALVNRLYFDLLTEIFLVLEYQRGGMAESRATVLQPTMLSYFRVPYDWMP